MGAEGISQGESLRERNQEIPEVFDLIFSGAPTTELVSFLETECVKPGKDRDREQIFVIVKELRERPDGKEAITKLKGKGRNFSFLARIPKGTSTDVGLENAIEVRRRGNTIPFRVHSPEEISETFEVIFKEGKRKGFLDHKDSSAFFRDMQTTLFEKGDMYLSERVESIPINSVAPTFGAQEPDYIELLGYKNVIEQRMACNRGEPPSSLLIGTAGYYSASFFRSFSDKIDPRIQTSVIDINPLCVAACRKHGLDAKMDMKEGDARELPYAPESFSSVYTGSLLSGMFKAEPYFSDEDYLEDIKKVFQNAYRVLRRGGSLIMVESTPTEFLENRTFGEQEKMNEMFKNDILRIAREAGFELVRKEQSRYFLFPQESGKAVIDKNGFGNYRGLSLAENYSNGDHALRFDKK